MSKRLFILAAAAAAIAGGGAVARASGGEPAPGMDAEPHFVPLDAMTVPIVGSTRIEGTLRVKLVLDAADAAAAGTLEERKMEVRSALLACAIEFSRLYASGLTPVNAELLRSQMNGALQQANAGAARVLVVEVAAQPA